jgi:hypothetical protein
MVKMMGPDVVIVEKEPHSILAAKSRMTLAEEQARMLIAVFGQLTSVVFETRSIRDLFIREGQSDEFKELLAHALTLSLAYQKHASSLIAGKLTSNQVFMKYWDLSVGSINLQTLNEMLQSNRDNPNLVEPLAKALVVFDASM